MRAGPGWHAHIHILCLCGSLCTGALCGNAREPRRWGRAHPGCRAKQTSAGACDKPGSMDLTLFILARRWGQVAGQTAGSENFGYRRDQVWKRDSGVVVHFITAVIPASLLGGTNFMKRKSSPGESGAEQNKSAASRAFRANSDCRIGKSRKSLPEIATVRTKQRDIDARDQRSLRAALGHYCVRRKLMRPMGLLQRIGLRGV